MVGELELDDAALVSWTLLNAKHTTHVSFLHSTPFISNTDISLIHSTPPRSPALSFLRHVGALFVVVDGVTAMSDSEAPTGNVEPGDLCEHPTEHSDGSEDGFKDQKIIALNETVGNVCNSSPCRWFPTNKPF